MEKKCPVWDCVNGIRSVLKPVSPGVFAWKDIKCPICNGKGTLNITE